MLITGNLRKMNTELQDGNSIYSLPIKDILSPLEPVSLNPIIGKEIRLEFEGYINSILSGEKIKKSFGEGLTYKEFMESPQASPSIFSPELSRIHEGIAIRDYEWEVRHHLQPHIVYISLTSGYKVGVTRETNVPYRWIDQGAVQAIKLAEVPYRQLAGLIEVSLKEHISDKTSWQKMLKGIIDNPKDILTVRNEMADLVPEELKGYLVSEENVTEINYPIEFYPEKVKSLKLDKEKVIEKKLIGIKGQYLIFEDGSVLNVRSHSGYRVSIEV
ncbi:MAG: DUF2797 domain-containing protein [Bacteroidia bacterium]|nr:DUF2797 domain-containing protein [Bacteroidia bacterium]